MSQICNEHEPGFIEFIGNSHEKLACREENYGNVGELTS
jgi:hypothetical protein